MLPGSIPAILSNIGVSLTLLLFAVWMGKGCRQHSTAHLLCVLALIKLVTPPLVTIDLPSSGHNELIEHLGHILQPSSAPVQEETASLFDDTSGNILPPSFSIGFFHVWAIGAAITALYPLVCLYRFDRLMRTNSTPIPSFVEEEARTMALQLKLKHCPHLFVTKLAISPTTWQWGRRICIVLPSSMIKGCAFKEWKWVLAHELAHVSRKDHLVRWLEWGVTSLYWWNPLVYWIRNCIRENEEICCDLRVLNRLRTKPKTYVESILSTAEILACPVVHPIMASHMSYGAEMERRMKTILKNTLHQNRRVMYLFLASAAALLPFGWSQAKSMNTETYPSRFALLSLEVAAGTLSEKEVEETLRDVEKNSISRMDAYVAKLDDLLDQGAITKADYEKLGGELEGVAFGTPLQSFMVQAKIAILSGELTEKQAEAMLTNFKRNSQKAYQTEMAKLDTLLENGLVDKEEYKRFSSRLETLVK